MFLQIWFLAVAVLTLVLGILLLLSEHILSMLEGFFDKTVSERADEKFPSFRFPLGVAQVVVGAWMMLLAFGYPELHLLYFIGGGLIFLGVLFLFEPRWLEKVSGLFNRRVFNTDDYIFHFHRALGSVLIVMSIFLFYTAYMVMNR